MDAKDNLLAAVQPGETVFIFDTANGVRYRSAGEEALVEKVTAKTIYVRPRFGRTLAFDPLTGRQKQDAYCHLKAWRSKEAFDAEAARDVAWAALRRSVHWIDAPDHLTTERINAIAAELSRRADE